MPEPINNKSYRYGLVQTESDPVCNSSGCPKSKWFKDWEANKAMYSFDPVKDYGYDQDIIDSVGNQIVVEN